MTPRPIVIVGAGPCGLACGRELARLRRVDHEVIEARPIPGGLASSTVDPQGFTWDRGGHVVFSHFGEFDRLFAAVMGSDVLRHERSSFVHVAGRWVPYPYQNHLHHLPGDRAHDALVGLIEAQTTAGDHAGPADDFDTWMQRRFGEGICSQFMRPYNEKVWAQPLSTMSAGWIADRVSEIDWRGAVRRTVDRRDDPGWGPNDRFAFPASGGTGEIYRRAASPLADRITYGVAVSSVDPDRRVVTCADGTERAYAHLVWTGALDELVGLLTAAPDEVRDAASGLVHNSVTVVGIGYRAPVTDERSWLYFPEPEIPFYRATNFGKYAPANVPDGRTDRYCSWMTEIASSAHRPLDADDVGVRVDRSLRELELVPADAEIASVHVDHVERAYPVPTLGRDAALATIQPWLMERGILARGRFGAWRYELGNMDHAVKMGVDAARWIVDGTPEEAWTP